jgi:hypothetical protein
MGEITNFSKGSFQGATFLVSLLGKVKIGEEVEIQKMIDSHFLCFSFLPFTF